MKKILLMLLILCAFTLCSCKNKDNGVDLSGVTFASESFSYDGSIKVIEVKNLPNGLTVSYENNGQRTVGEYEVVAIIKSGDKEVGRLTATLTIKEASSTGTPDLSGVTFLDATFTYDGNEHTLTASNVPLGVDVLYLGVPQKEVGEYEVTAVFSYELVEIKRMTATLTIVANGNPDPDSNPNPDPNPNPEPNPDPDPNPDPIGEGYEVLIGEDRYSLALDETNLDDTFIQYYATVTVSAGDIVSYYLDGEELHGNNDVIGCAGKSNNLSPDSIGYHHVVKNDAVDATIYVKLYEDGGYDVWLTGYVAPIVDGTTYEVTGNPDWIGNDGVVIFAYIWGGDVTGYGEWVEAELDGTTISFTTEYTFDCFLLVRCISGTTTPDWSMSRDEAGRIYNKTADISVVDGELSYSTEWGGYSPN